MSTNMYDGVKVIDLTNNFAGPMASGLLADFGAEVIHIEKPVLGDDNRYFSPMVDGVSVSHMTSNRGKKSLVLDLKDERAVKIIKELAKDAEIFIESNRPGVVDKLGIGYEEIKKINPGIIYCSISAYGQTGPYSKRPGYDVIAQAVSGAMYMTGDPDGSPTKIGSAIGDWVGALAAFGMIGHAMYHKRVTGVGQHVDISLARLLTWMFARYDYKIIPGHKDFRSGNHHGTLAPYGIYSGNNGETIIIGAINKNTWTNLCNCMGMPELIEDPRFVTNNDRCANLKDVIEIIEGWLKKQENISVAEKMLMDAGVPCAKIHGPEDIFEDPHFKNWITMVPPPDGVTSIPGRYFPNDPFEFSEVKPEYRKAPTLGQHNHEILEGLGYSAADIDAMEQEWEDKVKKK